MSEFPLKETVDFPNLKLSCCPSAAVQIYQSDAVCASFSIYLY